MTEDEEDGPDGAEETPIDQPLDGLLDLHTFAAREVPEVVAEYLTACRAAGLDEVRLIHGKGTGTLRRVVEGVLGRHEAVAGWRPASAAEGGWGATVARLKPR